MFVVGIECLRFTGLKETMRIITYLLKSHEIYDDIKKLILVMKHVLTPFLHLILFNRLEVNLILHNSC